MSFRRFFLALLVCGICAWTEAAFARLRTCVTVDARGDTAELEKLIRSELNRHSTHVFAQSECDTRLRVELIALESGMGGGRHLTGWLDGEVPYRVEVKSDGIAAAVEELLTVLLHNDPRRLRGPEAEKDVFGSGLFKLRVAGQTYFGFEAYQLGAWVDGSLQTLPGLAAVVRREVGRVHIAARVAGAHSVGQRYELELKSDLVAQIEAALFSSATADTSAFIAIVLGYELQAFAGPTGDGRRGTALSSGFSPGTRVGVELFRVTRARAQIFAQVMLPTFISSDGDSGIVDQWTPTAALGAGVLF